MSAVPPGKCAGLPLLLMKLMVAMPSENSG